jgi:hypothetical protein
MRLLDTAATVPRVRRLALLLFALAACHRAPPAEPRAEAHDAGAPLPSRDAYAGNDACAECHDKKADALSHDWHARALSKATPATVVGNFHDAHFEGSSTRARMHEANGRFFMRTAGIGGEERDHPVDYVIGGRRMQDAVTDFPDGRWQVLPVYFHVTGKGEWTDYTEAKQGRLDPTHPFYWTNFRRTVNRECLDCHATGVRVRYDPASHTWATRAVELGIGCESCHGPGARHAQTQDAADIVRPSRLDPARKLAVCAQCHGPRNPLFPILDAEHRFRPGDRYEDFFQPLELTDGRERSGDFFPDGRPKTSSFEYQALVQSRCFLKGGATCLSCHTAPHQPHGPDELRQTVGDSKTPAASADESSCKACHAVEFTQGPAHSHHAAKDAGCLSCHMPKVVTGVLDTFADHALDVPNPPNTERHAIPNACNTCHAKATPAAMQKALLAWWPDAAQRQARRIRLADAIDEAGAATSEPALRAVLADASEAPILRAAAAELFAQRFPSDGAALVPLLGNADPLVRAKAAAALGYTRALDTRDALAPLTHDASVFVRQAAALTLATFGDPRGATALWALAGDPVTSALPTPHLGLGILALRRGETGTARTELEKTIALQPYQTQALLDLADLSAKQGQLPQARAWLDEVLRFEPNHRGAQKRIQMMTAAHSPP